MAKPETGGQSSGGGAKPDRGGSRPGLSPNDDRGIVKNDNNPAFEADRVNRDTQKKSGG
jgi:hypothetical protein